MLDGFAAPDCHALVSPLLNLIWIDLTQADAIESITCDGMRHVDAVLEPECAVFHEGICTHQPIVITDGCLVARTSCIGLCLGNA